MLPVITGGDFGAYLREVGSEGVGLAGARGGFVHPLTSYTLPFAVETALAVAQAVPTDAIARREMAAGRSGPAVGAAIHAARVEAVAAVSAA